MSDIHRIEDVLTLIARGEVHSFSSIYQLSRVWCAVALLFPDIELEIRDTLASG